MDASSSVRTTVTPRWLLDTALSDPLWWSRQRQWTLPLLKALRDPCLDPISRALYQRIARDWLHYELRALQRRRLGKVHDLEVIDTVLPLLLARLAATLL